LHSQRSSPNAVLTANPLLPENISAFSVLSYLRIKHRYSRRKSTQKVPSKCRNYFTDAAIRALSSENRTDFWDENFPSFGTRVGKNTKTFFVKRANRRFKLGQYPLVSLLKARRKAQGIKSQEQLAPANKHTFGGAYAVFNAQHITQLKPSTQLSYRRSLEKYFLSAFATTKLANITLENKTAITDGLKTLRAGTRLGGTSMLLQLVRPSAAALPAAQST
jgi:hypothetical protein